MFQSVMAQRQGTGSSGVGYAFDLVVIKELLPDKNICLAESMQYGTGYQLGLDKRGQLAWPQTGDRWIIDRSMGHWALRSKITATSAPVITGSRNTMSATVQSLLDTLGGLGLVDDQTTAQTLPVGVWQVPGALTSPFDNYGGSYQPFRYMIETTGFVVLEGVVKTTSAITGTVPFFTLPTGFWPKKNQVFSSNSNNTACYELEVTSAGVVRLSSVPASTTISYASASCRFSTT